MSECIRSLVIRAVNYPPCIVCFLFVVICIHLMSHFICCLRCFRSDIRWVRLLISTNYHKAFVITAIQTNPYPDLITCPWHYNNGLRTPSCYNNSNSMCVFYDLYNYLYLIYSVEYMNYTKSLVPCRSNTCVLRNVANQNICTEIGIM